MPNERQILRFARHDLQHPYAPARLDGFAGLALIGTSAVEVVPDLEALSGADSSFEKLLALWTLERLATQESRDIIASRFGDGPEELDQGSIWILAGRVVVLAARQDERNERRRLDAALLLLYNAARGEHLEEKLLATWALFEVGTPVTVEVAYAALEVLASRLEPGLEDLPALPVPGAAHWPPPARHPLASSLEQMLFGEYRAPNRIGLAPRRAQVARTLAQISRPLAPEAVRAYQREIRDRLATGLDRSQALDQAMALGPWACAPELTGSFEQIARRELRGGRPRGRCRARGPVFAGLTEL